MRMLVVGDGASSGRLTGAAIDQDALLAGLARRGVESEVLSAASGRLIDATATAIDRGRPDVVMISGRRDLAGEIVALARRRGVPTMHQIRTPSIHCVERMGWSGTAEVDAGEHARLSAVPVADVVTVPSRFMAEYWAARLGVRPVVVHPVVAPRRVRTARRGARFVTFVNPEPGKGLALFWRLAVEAADRLPALRFLVVEGRWTARMMAQAGIALDRLPNVTVVPHQRDVRRIWARTSVLIVPSVMPEAFGMVVQEAQLNGVPVIASRLAGLPEAANGGGVLIAPPPRCVADWVHVPTAAEIRPWLDALAALARDRGLRARARHRALRAARGFAPARILDEVAVHLRALGRRA
jgi:glycosyltransferase involved in cell wall biosynthesis